MCDRVAKEHFSIFLYFFYYSVRCEDHLQVTSKIKTTGLNKIAHPDNMSVVPLTINI